MPKKVPALRRIFVKLWENGLHAALNENADDFNSSISFDGAMYKQDIEGSVAHATMLCEQGIISAEDMNKIVVTLKKILSEIEEGSLEIDPSAEDIHSFVEFELTKRIGDAGKRLHTARSRNDQVAVDVRLYLREQLDTISSLLCDLLGVIAKKAEEYKDTVMPGYTHLQRAQPITFGHHLCAYGMMFVRDKERLADCRKRLNVSPLGSCALSGTAFPINRDRTAELLGFDEACMNSIDGVSDRDFCVELASDIAIIMMHLSRFCEEIIMWCSWEFRFVRLSDAFSTGSSIMPQKKNPDIAIGNIVGSNLFNILAIAGTSSMVKPIVAKNVNYVDLLVMLGLTLLLLPLVKSGQKISRAEGWALIVVYLCYLAWLLRDLI